MAEVTCGVSTGSDLVDAVNENTTKLESISIGQLEANNAKLATIESNATQDQTKEEIEALGLDASEIITDSTHNFVTDAEKSSWNAGSSLELGETDTTAYRGDRGLAAYTHATVTAHADVNAAIIGTTDSTAHRGDHGVTAYTHAGTAHAPSNAEPNDGDTTLEGNTFNGNEQLVKTNGTGQLPAIDGSLLTDMAANTELTTAYTSTVVTIESDTGTDAAIASADGTNAGVLTSADWVLFTAKAATASPTFTGIPLAPTAAGSTSTTQLATTAFVMTEVGAAGGYTGWTISDNEVSPSSESVTNGDTVKFGGSGATTVTYNTGTNVMTIASTDTTYADVTATTGGVLTDAQAVQFDTNSDKVSYPGSADTTELNILDGATLTTTELNYVDGVTSSIQDQFDNIPDANDYVTIATEQDITAIKTFTAFPLTPSSSPTTDYQVVNKKYIDDLFIEDNFRVKDAGDNTAMLAFDTGNISTATTRTITVPDANITVAALNVAQTFTEPQRGAIGAGDNSIAFNDSNNFSFTATAANITVTNQTAGQSGTLVIASADNITGWGSEFNWGSQSEPTGLTGTEIFGYFIYGASGANSIVIGRV